MKINKLNIILLSIIIVFLVVVKAGNASVNLSVQITPEPTPIVLPTPTPTPIAGLPIEIQIPKISIDAPVEGVGTDFQGTMLVPDELTNVGWFNLGYRPGEYGNAVIAGHLDSPYGPAIFWNLPSLAEGDEIIVTDDRGDIHTFKVVSLTTYAFNEVPLYEVFGKSSMKKLNLITCVGTFNHQTKNYSHRLIVSAVEE